MGSVIVDPKILDFHKRFPFAQRAHLLFEILKIPLQLVIRKYERIRFPMSA